MATVRYLVKDVQLATDFYVQALDFELHQSFGVAMAIVKKDDLNLWLAGPTSSAAKIAASESETGHFAGWNRIVIEVINLAQITERLKKCDTKFRSNITEGPAGSQLLCEDPSGNLIELFESHRS